MARRKNTPADVWKFVDVRGDDECWNWLGGTVGRGGRAYGRFSMGDKMHLPHRVALSTVQDVPDDMCVLHSCDNPSCCNPAHLSVGTHKENTRDMLDKKRNGGPKGEVHHWSALTESEVHFIRHIDIPNKELARLFGVTRHSIANIKAGRTWKHVP